MGTATTTESEYPVGTLVVDIFDARTKALLFRGTATDEISDKPEKNVKKIDKASNKMFKEFPAGAAGCPLRARPGLPGAVRRLRGLRPGSGQAGLAGAAQRVLGAAATARERAAGLCGPFERPSHAEVNEKETNDLPTTTARMENRRALLAAILFVALPSELLAQATTVPCTSKPGGRQHCVADTSAGVVLVRSTGAAACLLGKTWGYDDTGVWVTDGCSGEFAGLSEPPARRPAPGHAGPRRGAAKGAERPMIETWGEFDPGKGFLVGRSSAGELSISGYALVRYVNQMPGEQTFTDHLGNEQHGRWPQRHLPAPGDGLLQGLARRTRS